MPREDEEFKPPEASEEFVSAVFARSVEQAEMYCELLNDHDIPALVGDSGGPKDSSAGGAGRSMARGVPVLVPEALLDEAGEVIAEREDVEEEFELGDEEVEDEDEDEDEFDELDEGFGPETGPTADEEDDYLVDLDDLEDDEDDEDDEEI